MGSAIVVICPPSTPGERLQLRFRLNDVAGCIVYDLEIEGPFLALDPLTAQDRRLANIRMRLPGEFDCADQGFKVGSFQGVADRGAIEQILGELDRIDRHLPESMRVTQRL